MSGSGGYYKYHCRYYYTHNCPNWVYINNGTCQACASEGREAKDAALAVDMTWTAQGTCIPHILDGELQYNSKKVVFGMQFENDCIVGEKAAAPALDDDDAGMTIDMPKPVTVTTANVRYYHGHTHDV